MPSRRSLLLISLLLYSLILARAFTRLSSFNFSASNFSYSNLYSSNWSFSNFSSSNFSASNLSYSKFFFRGFAAGVFRGLSCRFIYFPHACGKKSQKFSEKSSRKSPVQILQNLYNKIPDTFPQRGRPKVFRGSPGVESCDSKLLRTSGDSNRCEPWTVIQDI